MAAKFKIKISNPCNQQWDGMQVVPNGRFCGSCQKNVVDFTHFTDQQLQAWFLENGGDSCGKFNPEQLDRYIGKEPYSYFGFFKPSLIAAALFAFLNFPQPVLSQEVAIAKTQFQSSNKEDGTNGAYTFINGKVFDQEGTRLSNIEIELKQQNIKVKSATDGSFFIKVIKPRSKTIAELIFTSAAFEIKKYHIIVGEEKEIAVVLQHLTQVDLNEKPISDISMMLTGKIGGIYIRPTITTRVLNAFKGNF